MTLTPFVILLATASAPALDLASALAEAGEHSPALAEAAAELDAARAAVDEGSVLLPNPSLTGSLGTDAPFAGQGERRLGVALSQELPVFGTRGAALTAAEHELRAATARRRAIEVELSASVREALARVAAGQEFVALHRELAEAGGRLAAAAARRAEAENLSPAQANVAAVEAASAQADLASAAGEEREARAELCGLLGRSECGALPVAWPDAASEPAPEKELLELALASRGDLAAEHAAERAAASRADGAERARIPIPTLELGLERESSLAGEVVGQILEGQRSFDLIVRYEEGQFESQQAATRFTSVLALFSAAGMILVLYSHFRSLRIVWQVLLNIPLALIGSVTALWIAGLLTAGLALVPLALAAGQPGKEILHPVAVVILGGLFSSTVLDLVVTPAVFLRFGKPALDKLALARAQRDPFGLVAQETT